MDSDSVLEVAQLARRCADEMARYRRRQSYNPRYCYELFRHALVRRDDEAWAALYDQYRHLVRRWLGNTSGDADALVNRAFERFWQALPPERFDGFPSLDGLLEYLKRCTQCVAIDARRQQERKQVEETALARMQEAATAEERQSSYVEQVLEGIVGEQLYERAMECLNSPREHLLFQAAFEWDLKAGVIAERWPDTFASAQEVYRIKERILRRLRRDNVLRQLLNEGDEDGGNRE